MLTAKELEARLATALADAIELADRLRGILDVIAAMDGRMWRYESVHERRGEDARRQFLAFQGADR
jgi:hypothetical protein